MIRLLCIVCGVFLGWRYATGGRHTVAMGILATFLLSAGNLIIALREWRIRPGAVQAEAIEKALTSPDPDEIDRVVADLQEMRGSGSIPPRVVGRYLAWTAVMNAVTLFVSGLLAVLLAGLLLR